MARFEVLTYSNKHPDPHMGWIEVLVWRGDSRLAAIRAWIAACRSPQGAYVSLRDNG